MSGCRSEMGRLFQILGPATEKLLLPSRVFVLGTKRTLAWAAFMHLILGSLRSLQILGTWHRSQKRLLSWEFARDLLVQIKLRLSILFQQSQKTFWILLKDHRWQRLNQVNLAIGC